MQIWHDFPKFGFPPPIHPSMKVLILCIQIQKQGIQKCVDSPLAKTTISTSVLSRLCSFVLQDYLRPALYEEDTNCKTYSGFALQFLHVYTTKLDGLAESLVAGALNTVAVCIQCLQRHPVDLPDPHYVHNLIYHIINKALKRVSWS